MVRGSRSSHAVAGRPGRTPRPPADLSTAGREVWKTAWAAPWMNLSDRPSVLHLARLEDEAEALRAQVETLGALLEEPIVTPKGDVVGTRWVANPAIRELARLNTPMITLRDRLGAAPMSRARLGLAVLDLEVADEKLARRKAAIIDSARASASAYVDGTVAA